MSRKFDFENLPVALEAEKSETLSRISGSPKIQQILSVKSSPTGECPRETWQLGRREK